MRSDRSRGRLGFTSALAALVLAALVAGAPSAAAASGTTGSTPSGTPSYGFVPTGSMTVIRNRLMAASPLPNGKVLIAGGEDMNPWASAEVYDPTTGTFSADGVGSMSIPREEAVAAPLPNGDILIAGGESPPNNGILTNAELFDPATQKFSHKRVGQMTTQRAGPAAALLPGGDVLIVGGFDGFGLQPTAEIFDPKTDRFSHKHLGSMTTGRWGPIAAPLPDGKVLVAGGVASDGAISSSAELFDPSTGQFSSDGLGSMTIPRAFATAAPLPNGDVLIAGGISSPGGEPLASAELFDPASGTFSSAGVGAMMTGRMEAAAAPLPSGDVLIAGGAGPNGELQSAEVFTFPSAAVAPGMSSQLILRTTRYVRHVVKRRGRRHVVKHGITTTHYLASTPIFTTTPARATLARGRKVYATGNAELTRLVLRASRLIPSGQYTLALHHPFGRRWLTTRTPLTLAR